MGEYKESVNWHYSKRNISALRDIMNDKTIDTDDRELAHEYISRLEDKIKNENKEKEDKQEEREEI